MEEEKRIDEQEQEVTEALPEQESVEAVENPAEAPASEAPEAPAAEATKKKSKVRRILGIVEWSLIGALLIFDIFIITMRFSSSANGVTNFFGNEVYIVQTGSMEGSADYYAQHPNWKIKDCPIDSAVFVKTAPPTISENDDVFTIANKQAAIDAYYSNIHAGDVLTFYYQVGKTVIVTHRVTEEPRVFLGQYGNVYEFTLMGDNPKGDQVVSPYSPTQKVNSSTGWVIGKVDSVNVGLGKFIVNFIQNKTLIGVLIIAPAAVMFLYEVGKIILLLVKDRQDRTLGQEKAELVALREQVARMGEQQPPVEKPKDDKLSTLREYKAMLDEGLITQEEYEKKKNELLG